MADEHLTVPKKCLTAFASVKTMLTLLYFVAQTLAQHFRIADVSASRRVAGGKRSACATYQIGHKTRNVGTGTGTQ